MNDFIKFLIFIFPIVIFISNVGSAIHGYVDSEVYEKDIRLWKLLFPGYWLGVGLYKLFNIKIGK